ncbi:PREDICTED: uncharacterized protein LOC109169746 [Ipomoea nil]|uniref:uncharacterized protein LOC109169746 n=1 Tax=Ipomoea nil TaxID=35883 RepID=UPI000901C9A1|nr:PREDICTED: uncharacterized protein LOC109169746 [Ipomoea nil]
MEEAKVEAPIPQTLSSSSNGRARRRRRRSSGSSSFEFCVLRKPNLLSADQLFSDGVLLPLHLLHRPSDHSPEPNQVDSSSSSSVVEQPHRPDESRVELEQPQLGAESGPEISAAAAETAALSSSKRWRDIFKRSNNNKKRENAGGEKVNKDKKGGGGIFGGSSNGASAAERVLNINIWPFRRTKSAGNGGGARPLSSPTKASSAPCSGTSSPADFKSKKSPSRSSLVWPARRSVGGRSYGFLTKPTDKSPRKDRSYVERSFRKEGNKGWRKVSPAAVDGGGGDWHKARILTMNASMSTDASPAAAAAGGVSGEGPVYWYNNPSFDPIWMLPTSMVGKPITKTKCH